MRPTPAHRLLPALLACLALTAGCGSGAGGGAQDDPSGVARAYYNAFENSEYEKACDLILPAAREQIEREEGGPCQVVAANGDGRTAFAGAEVDEDRIVVDGDSAVLPEAAVTFRGEPSGEGDVQLVRQDGRWWIADA